MTVRRSSNHIELEVSDIEIGAVELKDASADTRASIAAANTARTTGTIVIATQQIDAGGKVMAGVPLMATHTSPIDGAVAYTSNVTVTCSGFPFTVDDTTCCISYIAYKPTGGSWVRLVNSQNGVSFSATANVITVSGAGTPFASGDIYRVGIRYQDKAYTVATNSNRIEEINPLSQQFIEESLVDTTNVAAAATYYPASTGMAMAGYKNFSITGKYIDGDATTTTLAVQGTNDEDSTNADWVAIQGQIQGITGTVTGIVGGVSGTPIVPGSVCSGLSTAIAQTMTFAWDFDNCNYRFIRVVLTPGDATNTAIIKARRSY